MEKPAPRGAPAQTANFQQTRELVDNFIYFYNHERIELKTGVAPLSLRHSA